jgi:hypothetical protein
MRARLDLCDSIALHATIVAYLHFFGHNFAAGRIDTLPDKNEGSLEADD